METSKTKCRKCYRAKTRIQTPSPSNAYRALDGAGRSWNGHVCPPCAYKTKKVAKTKYKRRYARLLDSVGPDLEVKASNRDCIACGEKLTEASYYYHVGCRPEAFMRSDMVTYNISWPGSK